MFKKFIKKIKLTYLERKWSYYSMMCTKWLELSKLTTEYFEHLYYFHRASDCYIKGNDTLALINELKIEGV